MEIIKKSIVIVWSWWAWLRCAIELREQGQEDILIIGDRKFNDAHTTQARWWINAALWTMDPQDSTIIHAVDTYREAVDVGNPDLIELLADNAPSAIDDLVRWWAKFHQEWNGKLTQRFFGAHSYRRTCFSWDQTWLEMIRTMSWRAKELWIPFLEMFYVHDLIVHEWTVQWVRWIKDNEEYIVQAPVVVFATWWYPNVYRRSSSRNKENFWEGVWMALQAWAVIWDLELIQFHPTGLLFPEKKSWELVTEAVRGEWWLLFNAQWERFMEKYDPLKLELSTRDVVARANFREIIEWRWTKYWWVFLDISHRPEEYIKERLPKMYSMIKQYNDVDISKEPVEVAPTTHYTMWGIQFDAKTMKTAIEWFYVAWECTMWVHWANRLWWNSLMETMVFGKKVAQAILEFNINHPVDISQWIHSPEQKITDSWVDAVETLEDIRKNVRRLAGILRTESQLQELHDYLLKQKSLILSQWIAVSWSKQEQLILARRLRVVVDLALLITQWALERKESRGAHFRSDYPELDDAFRKNYLHRKEWGEIVSFWKKSFDPSQRLMDALEKTQRTKNYWHSE